MKQKLFISAGLALLLVVVYFIARDLFSPKGGGEENPYEYGLDKLKKTDSLYVGFKEEVSFAPGLEEILGIAVDRTDRIYVSGKNGVEIYNYQVKLQKSIPLDGTARTIYVDATGKIWLGMEDHITIFSPDGKIVSTWKPESENSILTSIAVMGENVFVADAGEKTVYHYNTGGRLLSRIGEKDPQNGIPGFVIPSPYFDLGIDPSGKLWVVNPGMHMLMNFSYDGKLISHWGEATMTVDGFCGCCNPSNIAFLHDGSFVTSEKGIERIKIYEQDGSYRYVVAAPDSFEEGTRGLDLAVDSKDRIIVLDPAKKLVRIFVKK
jgi:sugar lactone lactonase YvrE